MREVLFLIDGVGKVLWSEASISAVMFPDHRARWEAIWEYRDVLVEIAHSHPLGPIAFSCEDEDTMEALTSALGRALIFSVVAPEGMVRRVVGRDILVDPEPDWAQQLRRVSGMSP